VDVAWDPVGGALTAEWELPGFSMVPTVSRYRYIKSDDRETQISRPAGERKAIYRQVLAQCALGVIAVTFRADWSGRVNSVTVNGYVSCTDPGTGLDGRVFLLTVMASRGGYARLDLGKVDPVTCLEGLRGQLSPRPDALVQVHPAQLASTPGSRPGGSAVPSATDLMRLDPLDFENLVAELFRAMGMEVMTTERSGDGGVDVRAMDKDEIRGGKLVIQVKRYSSTVPPAPVRDLYGTMLHEGAVKGILVTTAEFGPSAQEFAAGKPLTLIGGAQLTDLLTRYGVTSPNDLA
jgi:restriction system protein